MSKEVTIWHNPRCSKSRQTLDLLRGQGVEPTVVPYLETPPSPEELAAVVDMLGGDARSLLRSKEAVAKERGLSNDSLTKTQLIAEMAANPVLIERPVVLVGEKAALGRPPENVLPLLQG